MEKINEGRKENGQKDGVAYANIHVTELKVLKKKKEQRGKRGGV